MEDTSTPPPNVGETPPEGWEEITLALPALGILAGLSPKSLSNLAGYGSYKRNILPGTVLINEGDEQDRFYVVVSGKLAINAMACGQEVALSVAEAGECLGEVSLLDPGPASASVKVVELATLWSMNMEDLRKYISEHAGGGGSLLMGMASCLSQRLRHANHLIAQSKVIKVEIPPTDRERAITAGDTPVQLGFFDRLKKSMGGSSGGGGEKKVRISTDIKL
jgi:CRP-like cAMP-binding protein